MTLNIVQKTFIEAKHEELGVPKVAAILGVTEKLVIAHIKKMKPAEVSKDAKQARDKESHFESLLAKHPSPDPKNNVVVLTQGAAEYADENKAAPSKHPDFDKCIAKARP